MGLNFRWTSPFWNAKRLHQSVVLGNLRCQIPHSLHSTLLTHFTSNFTDWLVVSTPLKHISQLGWLLSQCTESHKSHVPVTTNQSPDFPMAQKSPIHGSPGPADLKAFKAASAAVMAPACSLFRWPSAAMSCLALELHPWRCVARGFSTVNSRNHYYIITLDHYKSPIDHYYIITINHYIITINHFKSPSIPSFQKLIRCFSGFQWFKNSRECCFANVRRRI